MGARRMVGAGLWRRLGARAGAIGGAINYLLDYAADLTFTRASEAAFYDPRTSAFSDWVTAAEHFSIESQSNIVAGALTESNVTTATGVTDPAGGTDAITVTDNSAGAAGYVQSATGTNPAAPVWLTFRVRKESSPGCWTTTYFYVGGTGRLGIDLDHSTGRYQIATGTGPVSVQVIDGWIYVSGYIGAFAGTGCYVRHYPAYGTTPWTQSNAATGSSVLYDLRVTLASALTESPSPWQYLDRPRIFSDGHILIEGARTNLVTHSADLTNAIWTNVGTPVRSTSATPAPDGSTAYQLEDDSAAAQEGIAHAITVTATGTHIVSAYILKDAVTTRMAGVRIAATTATLAGSAAHEVHLNTSTGAALGGGGTPGDIRVTDEGAWWRLSWSFSVSAVGGVSLQLYSARATVLGTPNVAAVGTAAFWGTQLEAGPYLTSPIRTAGAAGTRAEDDVRVNNGLWDDLKTGSFGIRVEWAAHDGVMPVGGTRIRVFNGTNANDLLEFYSNGAVWNVRYYEADGGIRFATTGSLGVLNVGDLVEIEVSRNGTEGIQARKNGGSWVGAALSGTATGWTASLGQLFISANNGGNTDGGLVVGRPYEIGGLS